MYEIKDLERATGYTTNQVRDRLALLSPIFAEDIHRGSRGKILVGDKILAALRRMAELESQGLSPKVAQSQIIQELGNGDGKQETTFGEPWQRLLEEKDKRIAQLEEEIAFLRERIIFLESQVQLALPAPRRRRWWWPWRKAEG